MNTLSSTTSGQKVLFDSVIPSSIDFGASFRPMTEQEFFDFCQRIEPIQAERNSEGEIIIMAPVYSETGRKNFSLSFIFGKWAEKNGTGLSFDSSAGFVLPNGAIRSPDLSWISLKRWSALSDEQRSGFAHICPDFVVELRSETDSLTRLQSKMDEYIDNGAELGWLIDPMEKKVYIYRQNRQMQILNNPSEISGDNILPGFVLDMAGIWG